MGYLFYGMLFLCGFNPVEPSLHPLSLDISRMDEWVSCAFLDLMIGSPTTLMLEARTLYTSHGFNQKRLTAHARALTF